MAEGAQQGCENRKTLGVDSLCLISDWLLCAGADVCLPMQGIWLRDWFIRMYALNPATQFKHTIWTPPSLDVPAKA